MHAAEDLVAAVRSGRVATTATVIDQALACLDLVARWADAFETEGELPPDAGQTAREASDRLRALLSPAAAAAAPAGEALPEWAVRLLARHRDIGAQAGATEWHAVAYEPHAGCFFDGDDPLQLLRRIPGLLALRVEARKARSPSSHPFVPASLSCHRGGAAPPLSAISPSGPRSGADHPVPPDACAPQEASAASRAIVDKVIGEQCAMLRAAGAWRAWRATGGADCHECAAPCGTRQPSLRLPRPARSRRKVGPPRR